MDEIAVLRLKFVYIRSKKHMTAPHFSKTLPLSFLIIGPTLFSCDTNVSDSAEKNVSLSVVDSINVEFLGNLKLEAYNPVSDQYLLSNDGMSPILEVNSNGGIVRDFKISQDGQR